MKSLLIGIVLGTMSLSAVAESGPVCLVQANHWYNMDNYTMAFNREMNREECMEKGEALFNSDVTSRTRIINVIKNKLIYKTQMTQYRSVKVTYYPADGRPETETFFRDEVVKGPVTMEEVKIESGFKCWTKDECVAK